LELFGRSAAEVSTYPVTLTRNSLKTLVGACLRIGAGD
jgi:hypothetical protein